MMVDEAGITPQEAPMLYNAEAVQAFYDAYGTREWERLERSLQGRIKHAIHRHFLEAYIPRDARVLDVGCGPGRFALDLARGGARLTLADLSRTQLDQAREHLAEAGLLASVEAFHHLDVVDMHELPDEAFDAVVCYGAVLSYTYDRHMAALQELARVLRPGGWLLVSVVSLYGTWNLAGPLDAVSALENPDAHIDLQAFLSGAGVVLTRPGSREFHQPMVLFSSAGLRDALERVGLAVTAMAAADPLVSEVAQIPRITASPQATASLTELELALCTQPGLIDSGEHLIAVARKPQIECGGALSHPTRQGRAATGSAGSRRRTP
jgi:ubiquinone/menaquinone biosynthesis C-methylase UbiE